MYFHSLPQQAWLIALLSACGFALWRGRRPERIVAVAFLIASFVQPFILDHNWLSLQLRVLVVDAVLLAALIVMTLATDRTWLLFATAFQLLSVVIHIAILVDRSVAPLPYRRGLVIWSYMTLVALAVGTWQTWRRAQAETDAIAPARR